MELWMKSILSFSLGKYSRNMKTFRRQNSIGSPTKVLMGGGTSSAKDDMDPIYVMMS